MPEKLTRYDSAEYLRTDEDVACYLKSCLAEGGDDPAFLAHALGVIARALGLRITFQPNKPNDSHAALP